RLPAASGGCWRVAAGFAGGGGSSRLGADAAQRRRFSFPAATAGEDRACLPPFGQERRRQGYVLSPVTGRGGDGRERQRRFAPARSPCGTLNGADPQNGT